MAIHIVLGVSEHIDDFTRAVRARIDGHVERFPFPRLTRGEDGPWEGICRAMSGADGIHLMNGWFSPSGEERLEGIEDHSAEVLYYFHAPHRTLVVRFTNPNSAERRYLVCISVRRMEVAANWRAAEMWCSRVDDDRLFIEDRQQSIHIDCYAARLFDDAAFKHWLGTNGSLAGLQGAESDVRFPVRL